MKAKVISVLVLGVAIGFTSAAMAGQYDFSFNGSGITASGMFSTSPGASAGQYDITSISGTFSDSNVGVSNAAINGLYNPSYVNTIPGIASTPAGTTYDDLFFPAGNSPADCPGYPFSGGQLDIFGVAFNVAGGYIGGIWSNGYLPDNNSSHTFPGAPGYVPNLVYAAGLTQGTSISDLPNAAFGPNVPPPGRYGSFSATPTPEPASLALFGIGLLGVAALWLRKNDRLHSPRM